MCRPDNGPQQSPHQWLAGRFYFAWLLICFSARIISGRGESEAMATIFISYSRSDAGFVRRLADHLKAKSIDHWLDVDRIQAGEDWSDAVWAALQKCDAMLLVLSPASMSSKEVANEWKYYHNTGKPIIPVLVDSSTNIHYQLVALHYVAFDGTTFDDAAQLLESEIARAVPGFKRETIELNVPAEPPLPKTAALDPSVVEKVKWDRTTARIDRDFAKNLEDRLHHFDEQMVLEFVSYEHPDQRLEAQIRRGREYVLGRTGSPGIGPDIDLTALGASDHGLSRKHASLKLDGDTLFIKDLQSTNFTHVEGKRLRGDEQLALKSGDRVQMGNLLLMVYFRPKT